MEHVKKIDQLNSAINVYVVVSISVGIAKIIAMFARKRNAIATVIALIQMACQYVNVT